MGLTTSLPTTTCDAYNDKAIFSATCIDYLNNTDEHKTSSFNDDVSGMFKSSFDNSSVSILPEKVSNFYKFKKRINEFEKNFLKLEEYSNFERNWYGEDEPAFSDETIKNSKKILPPLSKQPEVFPARDGSIQMEFENEDSSNYVQINIYNDTVSLYSDFNGVEVETSYNFFGNEKNVTSLINMYVKVL